MNSSIRRAKIVCTLGPASRRIEMIEALMKAGMDVVRLNFSHGAHSEHAETIASVREVSYKLQKPISIVADLQGPKIRTGPIVDGGTVFLKAGQEFSLTTEKRPGDAKMCSTNYRRLPQEVKKGDRILLSDGLIELSVTGTSDKNVKCEVLNGGELGSHKGINLPGAELKVQALTPKDRSDLNFALEHGVNWIAVSFVRSAADVEAARSAIRRAGHTTPIIAKLEKPQALENLESILRVTDGVMVARGDLGVEMNPETVPVAQKKIIAAARYHALPVITATQMLESMTVNPRPTRAEASDVANAIFDGSDAVMLSAETASGRYPIESVEMMARIIHEAEDTLLQTLSVPARRGQTIAGTICEAVCHAALDLDLKVIAVFTESGSTARLLSKFRPRSPIVAFSEHQPTRRKMSLYWGVLPRKIGRVKDIDQLADLAERRLLEERLVKKGEMIGIVSGTPLGKAGTTNMVKIHVVGASSSSVPRRIDAA
jgi:pyruvate kinase